MGDGVRLALRVDGVLEPEVGVVEEREDVLGLHGHVLRTGKQLFFGIAQDVPALAKDHVQGTAIEHELRADGVELLHLRIIELEQFGSEPARGARDIRVDGYDLRGIVLIGGVARILVELALRVVHELTELDAGLVAQAQVGKQLISRLRDLAAIGRELGRVTLRLLERCEKRLVMRIDTGEVPAIALFDFVTGFVCHGACLSRE